MNWNEQSEPTDFAPSAEDEYFASLEPEQDYTADLILALSILTEKQRFVIECRYGMRGDPLSVCEIASLMGVRHQNVVKLEQRAMRRMRKRVQKTPIYAPRSGQKEAPPQRGSLSG